MTALTDTTRERIWLIHAHPRDAGGAVVDRYLSKGNFETAPTDSPASVAFDNVVLGPLQYSVDLAAAGGFRGRPSVARGRIQLANDGSLFPLLALAWPGAEIEIDVILSGQAYASRQRVATVKASGIEAPGTGEISILIASILEDLDKPVTDDTYAGTGGLEGEASSEGQVVPVGLGIVRGADAVLLDAVKQIYQVHAPAGGIQAVAGVFSGGDEITAGTARAGYAALDSNTPTGGTYDYAVSVGAIRMGSLVEQDRPVRIDFQGDKTGGSHVASAAQVAERLMATYGGLSAARYDAASVAALHAANGAALGIWFRAGGNLLAALGEVLASAGAVPHEGVDGLVRFYRLALPAITGPDHADCAMAFSGYANSPHEAIDLGTLRPGPAIVPPHRIDAEWQRLYGPTENLVEGADKEYWTREWRTAQSAGVPAVLARWPRSTPLAVRLLFDQQADVTAELARLEALYARDQRLFYFETGMAAALLEIGDQVWIEHPDFNLESGAAAIVTAKTIDGRAETVTLGVWM